MKKLATATWAFLAKHFAGLTLLIAALGGVPGIVQILTYRQNQPILHAIVDVVIPSGWSDQPNHAPDSTGVLMGVTISNEGKMPLLPHHYELRAKLDGKWENFSPHYAPKIHSRGPDGWNWDVGGDKPEDDLLVNTKAILLDSPASGLLFFVSPDITIPRFQKLEALELTCVDAYERRYVCYPALPPNHGVPPEGATWTRYGINITPPAKSSATPPKN
jgi:hypothetical protein